MRASLIPYGGLLFHASIWPCQCAVLAPRRRHSRRLVRGPADCTCPTKPPDSLHITGMMKQKGLQAGAEVHASSSLCHCTIAVQVKLVVCCVQDAQASESSRCGWYADVGWLCKLKPQVDN